MLKRIISACFGAMLFGAPVLAQSPALPQQAQQVVGVTLADSGDTAWMLATSLIALIMIIPGLVLFYGGQVRAKNSMSVVVQCLATTAIVSLLWVIAGYSLAFADGTAYLGGFDSIFLTNLAEIRVDTTVPESSFVLYQLIFAVLAPVLIIGSFVERARFGWALAFSALWSLCVYVPVTHWLWGGGWLTEFGAHDFAGGLVVNTSVGVSALVVALMLGKRNGFGDAFIAPHSSVSIVAGAGLLWLGWLGLAGGSALAAGDDASTAIINTHVAACAAALVWALIERLRLGKASSIGLAKGALAGLAMISSAAGYVGPGGAMALGGLAGLLGIAALHLIKERFAIDDALDVFAVQGVGGIAGALLFPVFVPILGGPGFEEGAGLFRQLGAQGIAVGAVTAWSLGVTLIIGLGLTLVLPMRVSEAQEAAGLDNAIDDDSMET